MSEGKRILMDELRKKLEEMVNDGILLKNTNSDGVVIYALAERMMRKKDLGDHK